MFYNTKNAITNKFQGFRVRFINGFEINILIMLIKVAFV